MSKLERNELHDARLTMFEHFNMNITENEVDTKFKETVGKSKTLKSAIELHKWLKDNKSFIERDYYDLAILAVRKCIEERNETLLENNYDNNKQDNR